MDARAARRQGVHGRRGARGVGVPADVTPDARLVLAHVGVATWSDCPEDAAFLQAELLECLRPTGATTMTSWLMLIGGLVAFLLYCRVVLFDRIDDSSKALARQARLRWRTGSCQGAQ